MLVSLQLQDGSEQTLDIINIKLKVNGAPLDLSMKGQGRLELHARGDEKNWYQLVVYPSAANSMAVDLLTHYRNQNVESP